MIHELENDPLQISFHNRGQCLYCGSCHPKSNDNSFWIRLDHRENDGNLNGPFNQHHFECQENQPGDKNYQYRYIRWIHENSWDSNCPYHVCITYLELYGEIFDND